MEQKNDQRLNDLIARKSLMQILWVNLLPGKTGSRSFRSCRVLLLCSEKGLFACVTHSPCATNPLLSNAAVMCVCEWKKKRHFPQPSPNPFVFQCPTWSSADLIRTMFLPYCCTGAKLRWHSYEVVPHKGRGIWSKTPCVLAHVMHFSHTQWDTPSFPTACPISDSLTSKGPSIPVPRSLPGTRSGSRCVRGRVGATVRGEMQGGRGKLPQQPFLNLAACISFPNPADKSRCTLPCVIARLSEGTGYLRTCFHRGIILSRVVWDLGFTRENTVML